MLAQDQVRDLLMPYTADSPLAADSCDAIASYIDLLMRWNARTNLTAIRDERVLMQRQVGESLFAMRLLQPGSSLLDFGSGAGFPGIPLAIAMPELRVTLAESQGKKASFLREAVRSLGLDNAEVASGRVEMLPIDRVYDAVVMRAVDQSASMLPVAETRVAAPGRLMRYLSTSESTSMNGWTLERVESIPLSEGRLASWTR